MHTTKANSIGSLNYEYVRYTLVKDLQGNVIGLADKNGNLAAKYTYDAWGNILSVTDGQGNDVSGNPGHIANVNPLRYRGYYFDQETGFYYLHTRYYDPKVGRFINADGYVTTDSGLSGANMFTYCKNNPVMMTDPDGNKPVYKILEEQANTANAIIEAAKPKPRSATARFVSDIMQDFKNYDINNESEEKVLQSKYFSAYKGVPVVRINGDRSGSFGMIFLTRKTNSMKNPEDTIRHEYGHTKQLQQLGVLGYAMCIGLPSWQKWGSGEYYSKPWEITADIYGGVQSRSHTQDNIDAGFQYLETSKYLGLFAWLLIQ